MKSKNFDNKSGIGGFINNAELNSKLAALATKAELKAEQYRILKLQAFASCYFREKKSC